MTSCDEAVTATRPGRQEEPRPSMERQQEYVMRPVEERGVKLVRLWFTDVAAS